MRPGLRGGHTHTLAVFSPRLTTQDARVGLRNRRRKGTTRPHRTWRTWRTWRSCAVGRDGLRCGILRITPGRIHGRGGLCHRLRGRGRHGCIEDGITNLIAHLLKRRVFSIQRNGQLLTSSNRTLAGNHPVFLIDIQGGEKDGDEKDENSEQNVTPINTQSISQRLKTPLQDFLDAFESNFHEWFLPFLKVSAIVVKAWYPKQYWLMKNQPLSRPPTPRLSVRDKPWRPPEAPPFDQVYLRTVC